MANPHALRHSQSLLNIIHSRSQGYNDSTILNMFLCFLFSEVKQLTILLLLFWFFFPDRYLDCRGTLYLSCCTQTIFITTTVFYFTLRIIQWPQVGHYYWHELFLYRCICLVGQKAIVCHINHTCYILPLRFMIDRVKLPETEVLWFYLFISP